MKMAVLADIHGNKPALDAVMADIERQQVDHVVVAGDLVNRGPANRAVVETIAETEWDVIAGNHDALIVAWARGDLPDDHYDDPWWAPVDWVAEQVADWIDYLDSLPFDLRLDATDAAPIRVVHGSPRGMRKGMHHFMSDETIAGLLTGVDEPMVISAHTHIPMERCVNGWHVVNTGAVGLPFNHDTRAQYILLTPRDDGRWNVTRRAVEYDHEAALAAFEETGYVDEGLAACLFRREVKTARNHLYPFETWAKEHGLPLTWETWRMYRGRDNSHL